MEIEIENKRFSIPISDVINLHIYVEQSRERYRTKLENKLCKTKALTYRNEIWTTTKKEKRSIQAQEMKMKS